MKPGPGWSRDLTALNEGAVSGGLRLRAATPAQVLGAGAWAYDIMTGLQGGDGGGAVYWRRSEDRSSTTDTYRATEINDLYFSVLSVPLWLELLHSPSWVFLLDLDLGSSAMKSARRIPQSPHAPPVFPRLRRRRRRDGFGVAARAIVRRSGSPDDPLAPKKPHFPAKAKSIIYLHMAGAPSTLDLFDYKPKLQRTQRQAVPRFVSQRTTIRVHQGQSQAARLRRTSSPNTANPGRKCRTSCRILATVADELCIVRSMYTEQFNHAPAQLFVHTGSPRLGRPSMGSWLSYGLGTREPQSAEFLRPRIRHGRARRRRVAVGQRLLADDPSGRSIAFAGRSGAVPVQPRRHGRQRPAPVARYAASAQPTSGRRRWRSRSCNAHRAIRTGVSNADQRTRGDGHCEGDERDPRNVRRQAGSESVRQQLSARPPAGGERCAFRAAVSLGLGQPRRIASPATCVTAWWTAARRRTSPSPRSSRI